MTVQGTETARARTTTPIRTMVASIPIWFAIPAQTPRTLPSLRSVSNLLPRTFISSSSFPGRRRPLPEFFGRLSGGQRPVDRRALAPALRAAIPSVPSDPATAPLHAPGPPPAAASLRERAAVG